MKIKQMERSAKSRLGELSFHRPNFPEIGCV